MGRRSVVSGESSGHKGDDGMGHGKGKDAAQGCEAEHSSTAPTKKKQKHVGESASHDTLESSVARSTSSSTSLANKANTKDPRHSSTGTSSRASTPNTLSVCTGKSSSHNGNNPF